MNIEQTKEAIRVMQAYVDGNEVEFKWGSMDWNSTDKPEWNWSAYDYRIKPTAKLRPWTADEVPLGAWIRFKDKPQEISLPIRGKIKDFLYTSQLPSITNLDIIGQLVNLSLQGGNLCL